MAPGATGLAVAAGSDQAAGGEGAGAEVMAGTPVWVALLGILATFIAVMIAFFQWRTAHQKVVLDLFERRMKEANAAVQPIVGEAAVSNASIRAIHEVRADARFV